MLRKIPVLVALTLALVACGTDDDSAFDQDLLSRYRAALPSEGQLSAKKPQGTSTNAVGDPAVYPVEAGPTAIQINLAVVGIIHVMRTITDLQPTLYNSATQEFLWGPWDNTDDFGTVAAYIKELPEGSDFKYVYALLRGINNDLTTMVPVIWGGATPDPADEDNGVGITLWDFEANFAFAEANDPDFATGVFDRGRFVAVYGAAPAEEEAGARFGWAYAVFRNFIGKEDYSPSADPTAVGFDLDYLYGHYLGADATVVDFLHFTFAMNTDPATTLPEDISVKMAFLNAGWGRAEASALNGDIAAPASYEATECWNTGLKRTFFGQVYTDGLGNPYSAAEGTEAGCGPDVGGGVMLFARPLAELGIPSLDDIDAALKAALENVAENGMPQE